MPSSEEDWLELADDPTEEFGELGSGSVRPGPRSDGAASSARAWLAGGIGHPGRMSRVAGVVVAAVLVPVLAVSLIGGSGEAALDRAYFARLAVPAAASQAIGRALERDLSRGSVGRATLAAQVARLATRQRAADAALESLSPPPRLRAEYAQAVTAFLLRTDGLFGLLAGLRDTKASAARLSSQGERLVTSDVLWQTFVQSATLAELQSERVNGLDPPGSRFLTSWDVVSPEAIAHALAAAPRAAAVALASSATLKLGDRGPAVAAWQTELERWLKQTGHAVTVATNGSFDQSTQSATISFQGTVGVTADGVVGPVTASAMQKVLGP
jgi:hypothetical protein